MAVVAQFKIIPQSLKWGMKLNNLKTVEYMGQCKDPYGFEFKQTCPIIFGIRKNNGILVIEESKFGKLGVTKKLFEFLWIHFTGSCLLRI